MANNIPAGLKTADIGRFALRAAQIEKVKPVVAYWCNFHIVNQIIERGLHNSDDEIKLYTTNLVEKLEQFKSENPDNDTITDSVAANAYVEQFGLEVFNRADTTMRANKVTKQTADTFQAAATFLELCQIWGPPDPEVAAKIKFAKYHALRIVKAIKAGEDPNATNPVLKEENPEAELDPSDPDAQALDESIAQQATRPGQPSVEEIPDESDRIARQLAHQSNLDESLHPSRSSSIPPQPPASRVNLPSAPNNAPAAPPQGIDIDSQQTTSLDLPSAPETFASSSSVPNLPDTPPNLGAPRSSMHSEAFQSFPPPSSLSPPSPLGNSQDASSFYKPSGDAGFPTLAQPPSETVPAPGRSDQMLPPARTPLPPATTASQSLNSRTPTVDDQSIALAQKHARWAVSALTFDDVNTAIKELRESLKYLGAE